MKKLISIFAVAVLVVMASGCTSDQWATNKTYSGSGITLAYPGTWNNDSSNTLNSFASGGEELLSVGTSDYTMALIVFSIPQGASSTAIQQALQQLKENWKAIPATFNFTVVSDKDLTVDGVPAVEVDYKTTDPGTNPEAYMSAVAWIKNDKLYGLVYASKTNDTQTLDCILGSTKST